MMLNFSPFLRQMQAFLIVLIMTLIVSLLGFAVFGDAFNIWRSIAVGLAISLIFLLAYPEIRGIRTGDVVMVPIWREIETPFSSEGFMDNTVAVAMESGRRNQKIKVRLWDGSRGLARILDYGFVTPPEGRLLEAEAPRIRNIEDLDNINI
ncbi:hypothetical protein BEH94_11030 [Candidatus Altiarchaeales archaeon WOR_SM1_SCG]|nr:hypothetical protein BEH94_11030 [Candidatus Altiarchaeales archaeon WOR_SM1_SCG]